MRHSEKLINAVGDALIAMYGDLGAGESRPPKILEAIRAAEAEEMKTDRQALVDVIASEVESRAAQLEDVDPFDAGPIADAVLAEFHVSRREPHLRTVSTPRAATSLVDYDDPLFVCPKCSGHEYGTVDTSTPPGTWVRECAQCRYRWPAADDWRHFARVEPFKSKAEYDDEF